MHSLVSLLSDNFLVYGGNGMKTDFGGHDNHHFNNLYAYVGEFALSSTDTRITSTTTLL